MALQAFHVPLLLFAGLELTLALVLLLVGARQRGTRAFAYLLILRAFAGGPIVLAGINGTVPVLEDPAVIEAVRRMNPYVATALLPATLYFLAVFPQTPRFLPRGPALAAMVVAPTLVVEALYFGDHGLYFGAGPGPTGPLSAVVPANRVGYMLVAAVLAWEALRAPPGPRRSSLLAVSAGFSFFPVVQFLGFLTSTAVRPPAFVALYLLVPALALVLLALLVRDGLRDRDLGTRRMARRYLAAFALMLASSATVILGAEPGGPRTVALLVVSSLWLLPQPLLCAYALLRHQLFDIDLKVKWTIKQSTVAAAFIGVFFVVSEGAQQFLSASIGPLLGIAAAGLLVFALAPLQRAAEHVARVAMPSARAPEEMGASDRAVVYRDAVAFAWSDGKMTEDERHLLDHLRERLGLGLEEAARVELEVTKARALAK